MTLPLLVPLASTLALADGPRFTWAFTPIPEGQTCTVEERTVQGQELRARYELSSVGLVHAQRPPYDDPMVVEDTQLRYDEAGRLTQIVRSVTRGAGSADVVRQEFHYDTMGNLDELTSYVVERASPRRLPPGFTVQPVQHPSGPDDPASRATYGYDDDGRLIRAAECRLPPPGARPVQQAYRGRTCREVEYLYVRGQLRTRWVPGYHNFEDLSWDGEAKQYRYNRQGDLVRTSAPPSARGIPRRYVLQPPLHHPNLGRTTMRVRYDRQGRPVSWTGKADGPVVWDEQGNLIQRSNTGPRYSYDEHNRLVGAERSPEPTIFTYSEGCPLDFRSDAFVPNIDDIIHPGPAGLVGVSLP